MSRLFHPRRSVLYIPGANTKALEKARILPADGLIFDLEDAVAPEMKVQARQQVVAAVQQGGYGYREIIVRINSLDTRWGQDDIPAIVNLPIHGILLPKVEFPQQVAKLLELLNKYNPLASLAMWIMVETPRGVLAIERIVSEHPYLTGIVMGTSDLVKEMQARHTLDRVGLLMPLSLCVLVARTYRLDIIDGVYLNLDDTDGFKIACEQGRDMGFNGKTLIHPKQIEAANRAFAPTEWELAQARKIILAWENAQKEGKGVAVVDGNLVENLHVEEAKRLLILADLIKNYQKDGFQC